MMAAGSAPVPGRSGGWIVANAIHVIARRVTGCSNVEWMTSQALRRRSSS